MAAAIITFELAIAALMPWSVCVAPATVPVSPRYPMLAISPPWVTALKPTPAIAVVAVCDAVEREPVGIGPTGAPGIELVPAADSRAPPKNFAAPALTSSDGIRSALAYEKSYEVVAALRPRSMTGVIIPDDARPLSADDTPA